jgi:demethylmenaquinone methyltransferase/2-methoxy-6-polyprenyl-1,4-benzoquinol methylase
MVNLERASGMTLQGTAGSGSDGRRAGLRRGLQSSPAADLGSGGMQTLPQGDEKVRAVRSMFDAIAPRYDLVNRIMTLRLDVRWRRRTVTRLGLAPGSVVLDLACGTGDLCRELQHAGLRVVGLDLSHGMLAAARTTVSLVQADALRLPVPDASVDGVTCGFALRNFVALGPFLAELARIVRPGGRIALLEVGEPANPLLRWGHGVYFGRVVPRIGALLSDADAYRYLPRSVAYLPPPPELLASVGAAGFAAVDRAALSGGIAQLITATRERP